MNSQQTYKPYQISWVATISSISNGSCQRGVNSILQCGDVYFEDSVSTIAGQGQTRQYFNVRLFCNYQAGSELVAASRMVGICR